MKIMLNPTDDKYHIYTDGACNRKETGGWGAILCYKKHKKEILGGTGKTTNNKMELTAVIEALKCIKLPHREIIVYSDSQYVIKGITKWMTGWAKRGFRNARGEEIKNIELWMELKELTDNLNVEFEWVRAHAGVEGNEIADQLANSGMYRVKKRKTLVL